MSKKRKQYIISRMQSVIASLESLVNTYGLALFKREYEALLDLITIRKISGNNFFSITKQLIEFIESIGYFVIEEQSFNSIEKLSDLRYIITIKEELHNRFTLSYLDKNWTSPHIFDSYHHLLTQLEYDITNDTSFVGRGSPNKGFAITEYYRKDNEIHHKSITWINNNDGHSALDKVQKIKNQWLNE